MGKHGNTEDDPNNSSMDRNVMSDGTEGGEGKGLQVPGQRMSILKDMSPTLSRKEKIEVFELKMNEFDDIIPEIEEEISLVKEELEKVKSNLQQ